MNQELFDKGLKVRREVLGAEYVDNALKNADDFTRPIQELVTQMAWGEIWTRPGLPRHTRSLVTMAMLIAMHREEELRFHVRGAIANGVTPDEMKELLLQAAMYCGVPAASSATRLVAEVLAAESRSG